MIFPQWSEQLTWDTGAITNTPNLAQKNVLKARIPRRANLRLERVCIVVTGTSGAAGTPLKNVDSLAGLIEAVTLQVSDPQTRDVVSVDGPSLVHLQDCNRVPLDEWTFQGRSPSTQSLPASGAVPIGITFNIFIRPPMMNEPAGNLLSIPMSQLAGDATLEVRLRAIAELFSTFAPASLTVQAMAAYRDTQGASVSYIKSELVSRQYTPAVTGPTYIELNGEGYPLEVLMRVHSSATYGNAVTGVQPTAANSLIRVNRGRVVGPQFTWETWQRELSNYRGGAVTTNTSQVINGSMSYLPHVAYWSPVIEPIAINPLSINSVAPWRIGSLEEQKLRFYFDNWVNANYSVYLAQRLLLGGPEDLVALNSVTV